MDCRAIACGLQSAGPDLISLETSPKAGFTREGGDLSCIAGANVRERGTSAVLLNVYPESIAQNQKADRKEDSKRVASRCWAAF